MCWILLSLFFVLWGFECVAHVSQCVRLGLITRVLAASVLNPPPPRPEEVPGQLQSAPPPPPHTHMYVY